MIDLLGWVPVITSAALGLVFLRWGEAGPALKILGVLMFAAAVYLQFFSRHALVGLLLQTALALLLAMWRRMDATHGERPG